MARKKDQYRVSYARNDKSRKGFSLTNLVMSVVTFVVSLALLLSYMSRWFDPTKGVSLLAYLPMAMPVLFLANLVLLLFWIIRWNKMVVLPLAVGLLGIGTVSLFWQPQFLREYESPSKAKNQFKVMTFNTMGMNNRENNRLVSSMDKIAAAVDSIHPDILCLQEFQSTARASRKQFSQKVPWLKHSKVVYKIDSGNDHGWGLAVYSRYPIINYGQVDFKHLPNSAIWCDVVFRKDTVRVLTAHLQTTSITAAEQEYISHMKFVSDTVREEKFRNMYHKLGTNYRIRAAQAKEIRRAVEQSPHPIIVCGDFNDTPLSYTYHAIARGLNDSYKKVGYGSSYTYKSFFNLLRIDYILYSDELKALDYASPLFDCSDHKPVAVTFEI